MKTKIKIIKKIYKDFKNRIAKTHYISLGENCLTDNILQRNNLKSFSSPFSHGRSNIDYAIQLEKENYRNLLNPKFLIYDYVGELKVVRNRYYTVSDNIYNDLHRNGFEFTHHDVINDEPQRRSYERKILRMKSFDKRKKLKFIYHYRNNENDDLSLIFNKAIEFLSFYQKRGIKCDFIFFTQEIVLKREEREIIKVFNSNNIKGYIFKTLDLWAGDDQEVFWARKDDDLIKKMLKEIK